MQLLLAFVFPLIPAAVQEPTLAERLLRLEGELERQRAAFHVPGCAIAVVRNDELIYAQGFGLANVERQRPVATDSLFAIGSTTKAFTATLAAMLVEEGKLAWDEPIDKYLPEFRLPIRSSDPQAQVVLRDLLAHRTGFARADWLWASGRAQPELILRTIVKAEPWGEFRREFHYNNVMYLAAGEATAAAAGRPWRQLLQERILEPLDMKSTTLSVAEAGQDPRLARGYQWDEDEQRFERQPMRAIDSMAPAGAINSNVLDMAQWLRFQLGRGSFAGRRLLGESFHQETWTQQIDAGAGSGYGLGWFLHQRRGQRVVTHGGNIDGFAAQVALLPEANLGYVLLANVTATPLQTSSMELVWSALLDDSGPRKNAGDHAPYLGAYLANFAHFKDVKFTVLEQDGKLAVDVPGQMTYALEEPDAEGKWYFELTDEIAVSFERGAQGDVVLMKMYQAGLTFELPREGASFPAEIDLEEAQRYLGAYRDPALQAEVTVLIQNQRLAVDIPRQMICELHQPDAAGKRVFRVNAELAIRFEEAADGSVSGFTFFERGTERFCPRVEGSGTAPLLTLEELHRLRDSDRRRAAVAALGAFRMSGKLEMRNMGIAGRFTILGQGADRSLFQIDLEPFAAFQASYDRGQGAAANSFTPWEELHGALLEKARVDHPAAVFGDWRQFFDRITVLREAELNGRKVWMVKLGAGKEIEITVWVDAETGDTLQEDSFDLLPGGAGRLPKTVRYSDFREVAGVGVPHRIESEDPATGRAVLELEKFEANVELPENGFRLAKPAD